MSRLFKSAALAAAAPAALADQFVSGRTAVAYSDLDLSKPADVGVLLKRINAAASKVCGSRMEAKELGQLADYESCRRNAVQTAIRDVGNADLTLAFEQATAARRQLASR